jgi:hypothetical protein
VTVAGVYGGLTAKRSILVIQGLPAAVALCLVLFGGAPPAPHTAASALDPVRELGTASLDTLRQCVAFSGTDLGAGAVVTLIRVAVTGDSTPALLAEADVLGEIRRDDPACPPELGEPMDHWYRVHARTATPGLAGPMFALNAPAARVTIKGPNAWIALGGDTALAQLRVCTSAEGLHFTAWRGDALQTPRVFHRYYSLGYDVEPSCTEADWIVPKEKGS